MNEQQIINDLLQFIHAELGQSFHKGLAKLAFELNLNGEIHNRKFSYYYMKYVYDNISQKKSHIQSHTGFSKHVVANFLKNVNNDNFNNKNRSNFVYEEFIYKLRSSVRNTPDHCIPIYGNQSVKEIFDSCSINDNSHTLPAVLDTLKKAEVIEVFDNHIKFYFEKKPSRRTTNNDINRQISNALENIITTKFYNQKKESLNETYFDQDLSSIEIEDSDIPEFLTKSREILRECHKELWILAENFEKRNGNNANHKVGIQIYQYLKQIEREDL
ncbi:hypothetical protein [Marinicella sp. W31]|uniref:hypothetical protein n=1 Tax=Marinicella sp. W31 TaxID=3023713 RepID=UPI003757B8C8